MLAWLVIRGKKALWALCIKLELPECDQNE